MPMCEAGRRATSVQKIRVMARRSHFQPFYFCLTPPTIQSKISTMDLPAGAVLVSDESSTAAAKKKRKKDAKRKRKIRDRDDEHDDEHNKHKNDIDSSEEAERRSAKKRRRELKKSRKEKKMKKKDSKKEGRKENGDRINIYKAAASPDNPHFPFDIRHTLAPMVGASELAFRLLCRKYGATLAYTPMISAAEFGRSESYRHAEFQTVPEDRPLVCHFAANDPAEFAAAARLVEGKCDAIDLNLGCPQRTAYVGHFGSYLLDPKDRRLVLDIVRAGSRAVTIPIFVKIRLLDTLPDTIELCRQLREAGAALIAIHGRYRASFERKGPGARDGPAMLDQIASVKAAMGDDFPILANGNVISYDDVVANRKTTRADGIMSAEGILDDPALYLERFGGREESENISLDIVQPSPLPGVPPMENDTATTSTPGPNAKKRRKLQKKLREIEKIEAKVSAEGAESINSSQQEKLATKSCVEKELSVIEEAEANLADETKAKPEKEDASAGGNKEETSDPKDKTVSYSLKQLYEDSDDRVKLAREYLAMARRYPVKIRSVIFHTRRMCRDLLNRFQLMEECVASKSIEEVEAVIDKLDRYNANPENFTYDRDKAKREKEALETKRREEGKRKAYEARMIRKAKREGLEDREFYLRQGAEMPTVETIAYLKTLPKDAQLREWKTREHSQHCLSYHLDPQGCKRDRACAFLHIEAKGDNTFVESDEVAG